MVRPVIGFDPSTEGFFWLVGQGGYGIQSAPAFSRTAAAMVLGEKLPQDVMDAGTGAGRHCAHNDSDSSKR